MAKRKTVTEARLERAKADLAHLNEVMADEREAGNTNAAFWADVNDEHAKLTASIADMEKKAKQRAKRNKRSRERYAALRGVGLRRTADGWE